MEEQEDNEDQEAPEDPKEQQGSSSKGKGVDVRQRSSQYVHQ